MMNFAGHGKFVDKELDKLEAEASSDSTAAPESDAPPPAKAAPAASEAEAE